MKRTNFSLNPKIKWFMVKIFSFLFLFIGMTELKSQAIPPLSSPTQAVSILKAELDRISANGKSMNSTDQTNEKFLSAAYSMFATMQGAPTEAIVISTLISVTSRDNMISGLTNNGSVAKKLVNNQLNFNDPGFTYLR